MDESKVKELLMTLRIYLKYDSISTENERRKLLKHLEKLIEELLPE